VSKSPLKDRILEIEKIKRSITKIDPAFSPAIKNLEQCRFGLDKPKITHYQSLIRSVIAQASKFGGCRNYLQEIES
jgi:hypothetical protein